MSAERLRIKICGVTREEHIDAAAESDADLVGLVLADGSPRRLSLDRATALAAHARSRGLESVALVVDADATLVAALSAFERVQFHGTEPCAALAASPRPTIRGFAFAPAALAAWDACPHVQWLLVDGPAGGGGRAFDHAALAALRPTVRKPILIAGGLAPQTVAAAIAATRPFGVDVSSGVERTRGEKDPELIRAFCRAAREA
jgi:phosphoribosylanthranilate isomerase